VHDSIVPFGLDVDRHRRVPEPEHSQIPTKQLMVASECRTTLAVEMEMWTDTHLVGLSA
jgi:hypothetical protein